MEGGGKGEDGFEGWEAGGNDSAAELDDGPVVTVDSVPGYVWRDVVVLSVEDDEAGDGDAGDEISYDEDG